MNYDLESIVIKVLANNSGNLIIPLKGYSTSGNTNCHYDWQVSVDNGAETHYSGAGGGSLTIGTGLVPGSEHLVIIKPTTVAYQWARAFGTNEDSTLGANIIEIIQDSSYIGYGVSATNTGNCFRLSQYASSGVINTAKEYMPDTVTTIGDEFRCAQYYNCPNLLSASDEVMGNGVTTIGGDFRSWMFESCTSLTNAQKESLSSALVSIGNDFRAGMYCSCTSITDVVEEVLPFGVQTIGNAFRKMQYSQSGVTRTAKEVMPDSILSIGINCRNDQYYACLSLKEITGEACIKNATIGNYYRGGQYNGCPSLVKAKLYAWSGGTGYRNGCFTTLNGIITITIMGDIVDGPVTNSGGLANTDVEKIYVDNTLVSGYKSSTKWSNINDDKFVLIPYTSGAIETLLAIGESRERQDTLLGQTKTVVVKMILNGTENRVRDSANNRATLAITDYYSGYWDVLCTHGPTHAENDATKDDGRCTYAGLLCCYTTKNTLQDFKDWLQQEYNDGTPVIVLRRDRYEHTNSTTPIDFNTMDGENIINIVSGGPDINELRMLVSVDIATGGYTANMFNGEDYSVESNWIEISEQEAGLTAGENITIENNVISAKDTTYTAGDNVTIDNNEISVDLDGYQTIDNMVQNLDDADHSHYPTAKAVKDAIVSGGGGDVSGPNSSVDGNVVLFDGTTGKIIKDSGVSLSEKQDTLTAGNGIGIDANNKISTTFIYGESTTAAATVQKEVSIPSITELNVGQVIIVKPTVTSSVASSTLKLNNFDAYAMLYNGAAITTSTDSIVWAANVPSMFYLDEVSGTRYWRFLGHGLDSNSTYTLNRLIDPSRYHVGTGTYAFSRYSLVMEKADGTWEKITNTAAAYSTGTTKTVNTNGFRLGHIRYYNTTTNLANGALVATSALDIQAPSVTAAYSFNCGTAPGWAVGTPIYLVGSMGADGLFYLDTTQRWSTQLPSTNDGKLYIRLGTALSTDNSTFSLIAEKPIFYYDNGIKIYQQADNKQDVISDLATIRSGAALGATAIQPNDNISELTNDVGYITSAPVTSVNNQTGDVVLTIPTTASDVGALPNTTKYGAALTLEVNSSTYVVTAILKDQDGNTLGTAQTIDLPLESVVVSGSYDDTTKKIILTLQSGSTVEFSVADLVAGLQSEITSTNKLSSDLVDDTNHTNKFVTAAEKTKLSNLSGTNTGDETGTTIKTKLGAASASQDGYLTSTDWSTFNNKQNAISDLATIRSGAEAGATALQPGDNMSVLSNDAGYLTSSTGVTSFNGNTGAVTYTAPVTSVNGNTGAVTVQETLVSGTNIKTINGNSLLGNGDIEIGGGAISGWNSYDYSSSHPASITLNSDYYNHSITINANGSTVTSVSYGSGYTPTPGAQYSFDIINPSTNDLIITILGTQLVVFGDDEGYVHNIFNFIYDDTAGVYRVIAGTENLLTQTQYDSLNAGARTDGVLRWIVEK